MPTAVLQFGPEMSKLEAEQWINWWKSLPPAEQSRVEQEKVWSLADWLYWVEPPNRSWTWWGGVAEDSTGLLVDIEVLDWPFAWGALRWLFRAAGANELKPQNDMQG